MEFWDVCGNLCIGYLYKCDLHKRFSCTCSYKHRRDKYHRFFTLVTRSFNLTYLILCKYITLWYVVTFSYSVTMYVIITKWNVYIMTFFHWFVFSRMIYWVKNISIFIPVLIVPHNFQTDHQWNSHNYSLPCSSRQHHKFTKERTRSTK